MTVADFPEALRRLVGDAEDAGLELPEMIDVLEEKAAARSRRPQPRRRTRRVHHVRVGRLDRGPSERKPDAGGSSPWSSPLRDQPISKSWTP